MHHRIGLLVIVITSTYPVPTPQPKIRMGLFFYVKILENNSVQPVPILKPFFVHGTSYRSSDLSLIKGFSKKFSFEDFQKKNSKRSV